MERLRTRVSPIPASSSSSVFPTVLEEPVTPSEESNPPPDAACPDNNGHLFRKQRRRLPLVQLPTSVNINKNSRSSRSFDSGISCLLTSSEPGSPGPMSSDPVLGSPNHISSSRQSHNNISSPCNSPGPRSPRPGTLHHRNHPLSPRPGGAVSGFFGPSFSRRFSEQNESYPNSTKSSDDSDSSPPTTEPSPPPNSQSPPPSSPVLRVSRRMLPETPKSPYNVWQQSRDSLDSGIYSRSTTCDSNYPGRNGGSPVLTSTSPPTLTRHSWRRGVARLPEPPINQ